VSPKSLPAVYGSSVDGGLEPGPTTTPVSFLSGILQSKAQSCSLQEEAFPIFSEEESPPSSPEPDDAITAAEEAGDFISLNGEKPIELRIGACSDTGKLEEKRQKVKNTAYKQFMKYVCSKSVRVPQEQNTSKVLTQRFEETPGREEKIAMVLSYLQRKKNSPDSSVSETPPEPVTKAATRILAQDAKTVRANGGPYEHRYQAQRDLIRKQKMQLEEQQKKIQELTLAKLQEEAKNSHVAFQKTIDVLEDGCTLSVRPQLKTLKSAPDFASAAKIVERMERRAKERQERKQVAAERRRVMEEERKKSLQEEEEQRRREEEEKKREESIRQRELRERNRKEQQRMLELNKRAQLFNQRRLYDKSLRAFKLLLVQRDELTEKARQYYADTLVKKTFLAWKRCTQDEIAQQKVMADGFYNRMLLRNSFRCWKEVRISFHYPTKGYDFPACFDMTDLIHHQVLIDAVRRWQVAQDMYEMRLQERVFRKWSQYVNEQHVKMAEHLHTADEYYSW